MPDKIRIIQKEWVVLTKPYINFKDSAVIAGTVKVESPCQQSGVQTQYSAVVNGDKAWAEYKR